jgi:hypothetical protein
MTDTYKERATMAETIIAPTDLSDEQIARWRALQGRGMVSAVGEYTPDAFWELLDAYEDLRAATGWRPIESAPKDGTNLLLGFPRSHSGEGFWMGDADRNHWGEVGWFECSDDILCDHPSHPTNWMPLPPPPLPPSPESKP